MLSGGREFAAIPCEIFAVAEFLSSRSFLRLGEPVKDPLVAIENLYHTKRCASVSRPYRCCVCSLPILLLALCCLASAEDADMASRRDTLLRNAGMEDSADTFVSLARLAIGSPLLDGAFSESIERMNQREDCADFGLQGVLRLLYQFGDSPLVPPAVMASAKEAVLNFKYWPDEPGRDSMCTWSENHHILFAASGFLAGQLYPDVTFTNAGHTGREKMERHRGRVLRWLDLRFRTGFSEWLSNVYYEEDIAALVNLIDFSRDEEISLRASMVLDLLLTDIAVNSFRGVFGSTHGRSYEHHKKWADRESTRGVYALLFGDTDGASLHGGMGATSLAISTRYRAPSVLRAAAMDSARHEFLNRQRMGIRIAEAERWGLSFDSFEDGMVFLSLEAYAHPRTINLFMDMLDKYHWWDNSFFEPFRQRRDLFRLLQKTRLLTTFARLFESDLTRNTREEVNIYTYRTPDYMLSSAQDCRKGYGGDQQHIWQATLGPNSVCFTTHPSFQQRHTPNYWAGSGVLPRVAQVKNVAVAIYRIPRWPSLYVPNKLLFTHAWLPRDQFDEVVEAPPWVFARKGDGFLALYSQQPFSWQTDHGEDAAREIIVAGRRNTWICELGRRATDGSFEEFRERIAHASIHFRPTGLVFESPSQGQIEFGWRGPLRQNGMVVPLEDYPRYDNPYVQSPFPAEQVRIELGDRWLTLDWTNLKRDTSDQG